MLRKLIIIAAGVGGLCLILFLRHHAVSAEDHIRALANLRYPPTITSLRGYFSYDYLQWNLQGRHSYSQVIQRKNQPQGDRHGAVQRSEGFRGGALDIRFDQQGAQPAEWSERETAV